jgi:hypothetical protein
MLVVPLALAAAARAPLGQALLTETTAARAARE